jgi:serpin B
LAISRWVKEETNNEIDNIINPDDITDSTWMILVNAVSFQADWKKPFPTATLGPFQLDRGYVQVPLMTELVQARTAEIPDLEATALELPYKGDQVSMS